MHRNDSIARKDEKMRPDPDPQTVFVVHGRNEAVRQAFFDFLRSIGLKPLEWAHALRSTGQGTPYLGDVLDSAFAEAQAIVVLFTGDDLVKLRPELLHNVNEEDEAELTPQARPNVLFEAGMAFGRQPERTIVVQYGPMRPFSDLAGRHTIRFQDNLSSRQDLITRLKSAGCSVDADGTDWHTSGDFSSTEAQIGVRTSAVKDRQPDLEPDLAPEELKILVTLAKIENQAGSDNMTAEDLAKPLGLTIPKTKHFLDEMYDRNLITSRYVALKGTTYSLLKKGRSLLVQKGII